MDNNTDGSLVYLSDVGISFSSSNPSSGYLSIDNTFYSSVPGVLSGDPNFATDNSGNPANKYAGPIFGIDIAPGTPAGSYTATVTIYASGGTNDPNLNGFTVSQNVTITVISSQTISFPAISAITLPASPFPISATASSGLPVSFASTTQSVCTVSGSTLTPLAAGTCSITATQAGNASYSAATPVTQSFVINAASTGGGGGVTGGGGGNPLTVSPSSLTINAAVNGASASQTVTLSYQSFAQTVPAFTSNFNTNQGSGWLSVSPSAGTLSQVSFANLLGTYTGTVAVTVNPSGLTAGTYTGTVNFNSGGSIASVAVTMDITSVPVPQPTGGIANAASAGQAIPSVIATGSYIAIYGTALAGNGNPSAASLPLPTTLNGAQVSLGGLPMPLLYASATQINAIVPQALKPGAAYPLVVTTGMIQSTPVQLTTVGSQPGIYTVDESGSGPGVIANALTGQLISTSNPAHSADYLVIYCTGLGPLIGGNGETEPGDGVAAPSSPLFHTTGTVTATIGGVAAPVSFAGLTPTLAGLYQVNVQLPPGVQPGNAVPVVVTVADAATGATAKSNSVTIAVQ